MSITSRLLSVSSMNEADARALYSVCSNITDEKLLQALAVHADVNNWAQLRKNVINGRRLRVVKGNIAKGKSFLKTIFRVFINETSTADPFFYFYFIFL